MFTDVNYCVITVKIVKAKIAKPPQIYTRLRVVSISLFIVIIIY